MITLPKTRKSAVPYRLGDVSASGMNAQSQPERIDPGTAQEITNLFFDGGSLTTRPGMVGQLTTPHGAAVYVSRWRYKMSSGTSRLPYTSGGKMYYFEEGASAGVEITKSGAVSFSFTSASVRFAVGGKWLYFLDSSDSTGSLWRVNLSSTTTAEEVRGLDASLIQPTATLRGGSTVVSSLGTKTWAGTTGSGTNLITSGEEDFPTSSALWTYGGGATAGNNLDADGGSAPCVELDADGGSLDYVSFTTPVSFPANTIKVLYVQARFAATENTGASDSAQVLRTRVYGCDSSGNRLVTIEKDSSGANQTPTQVFRGVFDFREYPEVTKVDVEFSCPTASGTKGVDVRQVRATAPPKNYAITNSSGTAILKQGDLLVFASTLYCANVAALATVTSANWSAFDTISADIKPGEAVTTPLMMRLGFKVGSTWFYSEPKLVTGEYTAFDTSLIKDSLTAVIQVAFEPMSDLFITGATDGTGSPSEVFRVSTLATPGNLTPDVAVSYIWTQAVSGTNTYTDATIEGSGSPFSAFLEPDATNRRAKIDLRGAPGTLPTLDSTTTHIPIYRLGGATPDGDTRARLVVMAPINADLAYPIGTTQDDPTNQYYWDSTNFIFYDNTPDESLNYAPVYQLGRDRVPTGCTALFFHAGRLWLARYDTTRKVNEIYASWTIDGINDYPYLTLAPDDGTSDPEFSRKGTLLRLGGLGDGDRAVAFSTAVLEQQGGNKGGSLFVMRQSAGPAIITGWRGGVGVDGAFALNSSAIETGGGLLAPEGVERMNGRTLYLGATGIVSTYGENFEYLTEGIEKRLSLIALGKSRYSQGFLCWHDRRLWAMFPGTGGSDGVAYLFDERMKGWVSVTGIAGFTSACSLSGGEDTGSLYLGARSGQIYLMAGSVTSPTAKADKATPSGSAVAIAWAFTSRRHGQRESEQVARYGINRPWALWIDVYAAASFTLSWRVRNERGDSTGSGKDQTIPAGRINRTEITALSDVRGLSHQVELSGSVTDTVTIHSYLIALQDGGAIR